MNSISFQVLPMSRIKISIKTLRFYVRFSLFIFSFRFMRSDLVKSNNIQGTMVKFNLNNKLMPVELSAPPPGPGGP